MHLSLRTPKKDATSQRKKCSDFFQTVAWRIMGNFGNFDTCLMDFFFTKGETLGRVKTFFKDRFENC